MKELLEELKGIKDLSKESKAKLPDLETALVKAEAYDLLLAESKRLEEAYDSLSVAYGRLYSNLLFAKTKENKD